MTDPPRRGYPLGALFVVVAASAVLVAGITPMIRVAAQGKVDTDQFVAALGIGTLVGLVLGLLVGAHQFRRASGVAWGAVVGPVVGAIGGLMALLPADQVATAAAAMVAGSGLVVGVALLMRRKEGRQL